MRFFLDQMLDKEVARALSAERHDVLRVSEVGMSTTELRTSGRKGWALVSCGLSLGDSQRLHRRGSAGIVGAEQGIPWSCDAWGWQLRAMSPPRQEQSGTPRAACERAYSAACQGV